MKKNKRVKIIVIILVIIGIIFGISKIIGKKNSDIIYRLSWKQGRR